MPLLTGTTRAIRLSYKASPAATTATLVSFTLRPLSPVLLVYLFADLVDAVARGDRSGALVSGLLIAATAGVAAGVAGPSLEASGRMIEATAAHIDLLLMDLVARAPSVEVFEDTEVTERLEVLRRDRTILAEGADAAGLVFGSVSRAIGTAVLLTTVDARLLLLPLFALPGFFLTGRAGRLKGQASRDSAEATGRGHEILRVALGESGAREARLLSWRTKLAGQHADLLTSANDRLTRAEIPATAFEAIGTAVFALGYVGALLLASQRYLDHHVGVGGLVLTVNLITSISIQVTLGIVFTGALRESLRSSEVLAEVQELLKRPDDAGGEVPPTVLQQGIVLQSVSYTYPGSSAPSLRDVDLTLPRGSVVAVVGVNGAGKSTLARMVLGLAEPSTGRLTLDGVDLRSYDSDSLRRRSSAVFQDFERFAFVARHSVGVGETSLMDDAEAVTAAIGDAAATDLLASLPRGVDTLLGTESGAGRELSGGEWQRIAVARSNMRRSPLLLVLDEPSAALDPEAEETLLSSYVSSARRAAQQAHGVTVVITHRLATVREADLIVVMADGRVDATGKHRELLAQGGAYSRLFGLQAAGYVDDPYPTAPR